MRAFLDSNHNYIATKKMFMQKYLNGILIQDNNINQANHIFLSNRNFKINHTVVFSFENMAIK